MNYENVIKNLSDKSFVKKNAFSILRFIAAYVNNKKTHILGRDLVIRALSVSDLLDKGELEILLTLVRNVGLFPYLVADKDKLSIDDLLALELHKVDHLDDELVFHSLQANIFNQLLIGENVVFSAPTSVGKSLIIDALVASNNYQKIVIVVPTIALMDETRRRLWRKFKNKCYVITHPSQTEKEGFINIYILTQERVLDREDLEDIDFFVIDEFYKMNIQGTEEIDRSVDLNLAFHRLAQTDAQFYMLGPNIQSVIGLEDYNFHFVSSEFSTVAVDVESFNLPTNKDNLRENKLLELCKAHDEPTIIYCQSPRSASNVADLLVQQQDFPTYEDALPTVSWIGDEYHHDWIVCKALNKGIGIHHGGVPRALQQHFIQLFNERKLKYLVCTSTIIEGVNTVAKNVIIYDRRKNQPVFDYFTYKNISGRAGRMGEYFVGRVYILESPPEKQEYVVDIPIKKQDKNTPMSLILDLDEGELSDLSKTRISDAYNISSLSPETIRLNRHTPVIVQNNIVSKIQNDLVQYEDVLVWSNIPSSSQLKAICNLIFDCLSDQVLRRYAIFSGDQLAWHLNALRVGGGPSGYVKSCVSERNVDENISDVVERSLKIIRNVICYRFPRDLQVVENIQKDLFTQYDKNFGDYSYFIELVENMFLPPKLVALDEYGVPIQTAMRIKDDLGDIESLDEILYKLSRINIEKLNISEFEYNILSDFQKTIA